MKTSKGAGQPAVLPSKLAIACAMLLMMLFGYLLANYVANQQGQIARTDASAIKLLANENNQLYSELNQQRAATALLQEKSEQLSQTLAKYQAEQSELLDTLSLYERIIAPETTQAGFALEQLRITKAAGGNRFRMSFILLQQRQNKAVIKGDLNIMVHGSLAKQLTTIAAGSKYLLPEGKLYYRFKYFQAEQLEFTLPEGFTPEFVEVETKVYQFTTLRGAYQKRFDWRLADES
ncbi:DUF6776 family protein [Alteromonas ponticola]|uniref:Agglutinin biogenesis protein MshI n=1 Tax=Alteromonas ponticola TaxID=2720613 RepID=A0ABX1QZX5_9ALTE|nr:DUF6776 family protein [Alteromonas ponticola]NMH59762.1 hypothetical protein [Alteromonas ponticola]